MESVMSRRILLRNLDAYPKIISEDFYSRTFSGGLISSVAMFFLFFSELRLYLHSVTETKLIVDTSRGERLRINFDIIFPALPCSLLSLDAMDISGEEHLDIKHDIYKKRIDANGVGIESRQGGIGATKIDRPLQRHGGRLEQNETYCGSCFGAQAKEEDCCNSCEEVREAYRAKGWALSDPDSIDQCKREGFLQSIKDEAGEGCNIYGFLDVNKVAGNFHFAPGKSFRESNIHVHDLAAFHKDSFNISHKINRIAYGEYFPGVVNPLDDVQWTQITPSGMYEYFLKVVPTVYTDANGRSIQSNQFSVTEHYKGAEAGHLQTIPGVFFFYDLSPIKVTFTEEHVSFLHFLTNVCAIIGGKNYFDSVGCSQKYEIGPSLMLIMDMIPRNTVYLVSHAIPSKQITDLFSSNFFKSNVMMPLRCFHRFWNTRFTYISWSQAIRKKMEIGKFT